MVALLLGVVLQSQDLDRFVLPRSKPMSCPPVVLDTSDIPELNSWGEKAKGLVEAWFPEITSLLATDSYRKPKQVKPVIKKTLNVPAYASGGTITLNGDWITKHPDDLGMVVHELTHVIQHYPDSDTTLGWLVEGIADYVRWWRYEPEYFAVKGRPKIDPAKNKYTDAYRTTAYWLAWVSKQYDQRLVFKLDQAMRRKEDPMTVFPSLTGKDAQTLWDEFVAQKP